MGCVLQILLLRELYRRGDRKVKASGNGEHNRTDAHMNSQRLRQYIQGLHGWSKPDGVPGLKGKWTQAPVSNLEAIFYSSLITREVRLSLGIQATLKGRPQVQR